MIKFCLAYLFIVMSLLSPVQARELLQETTLSNGMRVVLIENHMSQIVNQMVWYRVGSGDEVDGKTGLAHYLEHLMFKATTNAELGEFGAFVNRVGGQQNAFTSYDYTAYFQTVSVLESFDNLERVMGYEADRMTHLVLDPSLIDTERGVIISERVTRTDNNPSALCGEKMRATLFKNHMYKDPIIGSTADINGLMQNDFQAFYQKWYHPANAVLVVSGAITMAELKPMAEKYYGAVKADRPLTPRTRPQEPAGFQVQTLECWEQNVSQPTTYAAYRIPRGSLTSKEEYALEIASDALSTPGVGSLYKQLVEVDQNAVSAYAGGYGLRDYYLFLLGATPVQQGAQANDQLKPLISQARNEVDNFLAQDPADPEFVEIVENAKISMIIQNKLAMDSFSALSHAVGAALSQDRDLDDILKFEDIVQSIQPKDVLAALKKVWDLNESVTVYLRDKSQQPTSTSPQP